ncbi:hypothetical protein LSH36_45g13000 [Paralvinella palmiformis]|uniref:Uncharacterized protein n=1 Tax=Paralvinella palmiformis TaxID=53620 RepID=A0AAD9K6V0_9ANNE|nr:hypothetical protein LSH36_45g13000 [Paralvinella palmiformis]
MSYRRSRSDRKLRPPWIQTQLDQGYRPYSFYVEYQRTTPLVRSSHSKGPPSRRPGTSNTTTATAHPPRTANEEETNDGRVRARSGQPAAPAGLVPNGSGTVMLGDGDDEPTETSIAEDGRNDDLDSQWEDRLTQGNTQIWYRTGGDDTQRGNMKDELKPARVVPDSDEATATMNDYGDGVVTRKPPPDSPTTDLATESDRDEKSAAKLNPIQSKGSLVALSTADMAISDSGIVLNKQSQDLPAAVTVTTTGHTLGGETQLEYPNEGSSPKIGQPISRNNTKAADRKTPPPQQHQQQHVEPTIVFSTTHEDAGHMSTTVSDQTSSDLVTDDHKLSGLSDGGTIALSSNVPGTTDKVPSPSREDNSTQFGVPLSENDSFTSDTSEQDSTDIPEEITGAIQQEFAKTTDGTVTTETSQVTSVTLTPKRSDIIPCSTKHRSKTKKPSHLPKPPKPPRRRNRNRKRTRARYPQTSAPPSLSMGSGLQSTQKNSLFPLPNPYHPQIHVTQPTLVASAEHSFARNSTFSISGLSSAEVTGIAIGCIIAFWIILGPLVCIICRMRDKAKEKRREREQEDSMSHTLIEEMIRMELARGRAKLYRTNVDDEREIERLPLQGDCCNACNTCNSNGSCAINPQDYVIGNRYMEYTPVSLMPAPPSDCDKDYIINKTYMDSLDMKSSARDTDL